MLLKVKCCYALVRQTISTQVSALFTPKRFNQTLSLHTLQGQRQGYGGVVCCCFVFKETSQICLCASIFFSLQNWWINHSPRSMCVLRLPVPPPPKNKKKQNKKVIPCFHALLEICFSCHSETLFKMTWQHDALQPSFNGFVHICFGERKLWKMRRKADLHEH